MADEINPRDLRNILVPIVELLKSQFELILMLTGSLRALRRTVASHSGPDWAAAEKQIEAMEATAQKATLEAADFSQLDALLTLVKAKRLGSLDS
jgi:hypothetical protein